MADTTIEEELSSLQTSLTHYIHPAEVDVITCTELDLLQRNVGRLRRELTFVGQDLARIALHNKQLIYLLDYSELHSYVWPEQSTSQSRTVIRTLFEEGRVKFALPPGALMELHHKLSSQLQAQSKQQRRVERRVANPFIQAFLRANIDLPTLNNQLHGILARTRGLDERLGVLAELFDSKRLLFLTDILDASKIQFQRDLLQDIYARLNSLRPGKDEIVNWIDAHNYATTYYLTNNCYRSANCFFLTVTSSPLVYSVFENIKWEEDPDYMSTPPYVFKTSLVRHPVHLLYLTYLLKSEQSSQVIERATTDLDWIHKKWINLPEFKRYLKYKESPRSRVTLPDNRKYFQHLQRFSRLYTEVVRPLNEIVAGELAQEDNRRKVRGIEASAIGQPYWVDEAEHGPRSGAGAAFDVNYRSVMSLFDRLLHITQREVSRTLRELKRYPEATLGTLDRQELFYSSPKLDPQIDVTTSPAKLMLKLQIGEKHSSVYMWGERYDDYVSLWWKTNINFGEFMKALHYYVRRIGENKTARVNAKAKEFSGIYLYSPSGFKHLDLITDVDDITTDTLLQHCRGVDVRTVCLALPMADFYYDMDRSDGQLQDIAVVTHRPNTGILTDFIQWTNWKYSKKEQLLSAMRHVLPTSFLEEPC